MLEERILIQRVLAGDPAAERAFYDAHVDRVYRLAYRLCGDEHMAQDCTRETFLRAFDRLADFRGESALSTWLHAITVSVTLNTIRRMRRHRSRETPLDEALDRCDDGAPAEPDLRSRLHRAITALPELYRTVFVLHDVEGYTHEEIGTMLNLATGTSKARLSRARARLRAALAAFAGEVGR